MMTRTVLIRMKHLNGSIRCNITNDMATVQDLISQFLQAAFSFNCENYIKHSCLVRLRKPYQETHIESLNEIEMDDVLVYRPCEELRRLVEEGCVTPVLNTSRPSPQERLQTLVMTTSPTHVPCLKRKMRTGSSVKQKNLELCREVLGAVDISCNEKSHIEELIKAGDDQVLDALEQYRTIKDIKIFRRMIHGPDTLHRVEALDRLSSTFATLNVEPAASPTQDEDCAYNFLPRKKSTSNLSIGRPSLSLNNFADCRVVDQQPKGICEKTARYLQPIQEGPIAFVPNRPRNLELSIDTNLIGSNKLTGQYPAHMTIANILDDIVVQQDIFVKYDLGNKLGSGKYSVVKECRNRQTGEMYAVKIVDKYQIMEPRFIKRELEIMHSISHDGIVQLVDLFESADQLFVVMERCNRELFEYIDSEGPMKEEETKKLMRTLVSTVAYLHEETIVHRDIKPENILICGSDVTNVKLSDFGIARKLDGCNSYRNLTPHDTLADVAGHWPSTANELVPNRIVRAHTKCGTRDYVAPEVMSGKGYSTEADMWSVGIVTYVLMSGCSPIFLPSPTGPTIRFYEDIWKQISPEAKSFIEQATMQDPEKRLTALRALNHSWLTT